jgi:hypothetical protein
MHNAYVFIWYTDQKYKKKREPSTLVSCILYPWRNVRGLFVKNNK